MNIFKIRPTSILQLLINFLLIFSVISIPVLESYIYSETIYVVMSDNLLDTETSIESQDELEDESKDELQYNASTSIINKYSCQNDILCNRFDCYFLEKPFIPPKRA